MQKLNRIVAPFLSYQTNKIEELKQGFNSIPSIAMNQIEINSVIFRKTKSIRMEGILYVTDQNNKRRFVQIDLVKCGKTSMMH